MADFNSIESVHHCEEAAIILEIQAFISGEYRAAELPMDRDLLSESYIEYIQARGEYWDDPDYLRKEPETCFSAAAAHLTEGVISCIAEHAERLADHYPFDCSKIDSGVLTYKAEVTPIGIAYIWLKIFILSRSENNYLQFSAANQNRERTKFYKDFEKVFEYLAIFAVAGKYNGLSWMTSSIRSATQYMELLAEICREIGQGAIKTAEQLTPHQSSTNDGRIDAIHLTQHLGLVRDDSQLYLVQATTQQTDLRNKVVKAGTIRFFDDFFIQKLNMAKLGILVVPYAPTEILRNDCGLDNCVYFPLPTIFDHLGRASLEGRLAVYGARFYESFGNINANLTIQAL